MYYELGEGHTQIERIIADSGNELGVVVRGQKGSLQPVDARRNGRASASLTVRGGGLPYVS